VRAASAGRGLGDTVDEPAPRALGARALGGPLVAASVAVVVFSFLYATQSELAASGTTAAPVWLPLAPTSREATVAQWSGRHIVVEKASQVEAPHQMDVPPSPCPPKSGIPGQSRSTRPLRPPHTIAAQGKTAAQTSETSRLEPKLALVNGRRIRTTLN
jgi:hypothetical protein